MMLFDIFTNHFLVSADEGLSLTAQSWSLIVLLA